MRPEEIRLSYLHNLELQCEDEAKFTGKTIKPGIDPLMRLERATIEVFWPDWRVLPS